MLISNILRYEVKGLDIAHPPFFTFFVKTLGGRR
jgi:hypothetical protein